MKRLLPLLLILAGIVCLLSARTLASPVPARQFGWTGSLITVSDGETGDPLIGATITIASGADTLRGVASKMNWRYSAQAGYECGKIFRDSVDLEISFLGYKDFRNRYSAQAFSGYIPIQMTIDETSIAQVVVTGQQIAMVFRGDTTVYNAGAFKTFSDDKLAELLKQLPGVEIRENKIYAEGQEVKRVYVDGRNLFGTNTANPLTDMQASDVKNVRVYEEQSAEARHSGDTSAPKEKVMDVETKSKRGVILGGELAALGGASFEKDYSGRREIRHVESGSVYRHSNSGSARLEALNAKDASDFADLSMQSKTTPFKRVQAGIEYEFRQGDTTSVMTDVRFNRNKSSSIRTSSSEYFPTETYTVRNEQNNSSDRSKQLSLEASNYIQILRGKNNINAGVGFSLGNGSSVGRSRTSQLINDQTTLTHLNTDSDNRDISVNANVSYQRKITEKSWWDISGSYSYSTQHQEGWQVDTLTSTPGLRIKLRDGGDVMQNIVSTRTGYRRLMGEKSSLMATYNFSYNYKSSRQMAFDFLDDPQGRLDEINSYDYTVDYYTNSVDVHWFLNRENVQFMARVSGAVYQIARDERFPVQEHYPRRFLQVSPFLNLSVGKSKHKLYLSLSSSPQVPSAEMLRSTLDATNPLALRAGNPDLKMPNDVSFSASYNFNNPPKAQALRIGASGGYTFNYITSRRRLFLEQTPLPQYDNYVAQAGAQLTTQVNVAGNYNLSGYIHYSKQLAGIRSTLNFSTRYSFNQSPYYLDERLFESANHQIGVDGGISTGFSTKVKIHLDAATNMSSYTTQSDTAQSLSETVAGRVDLRFGKFFAFIGTIYNFYCNSRSKSLTRHTVVADLSAGRKFGKNSQFSLAVGATDILNRPDNTSTQFMTDYIHTNTTSYLGRYGYLRAAYTF